MRHADPLQRTLSNLPRLWQKYIGHDNNRDFFASTQMETKNMNRVLYRDWYPQILYNHHQSGPAGTILYSPPLRDPFNYNEDPMVVLRHRADRQRFAHAPRGRKQAGRDDAIGRAV